MLSRMLTNPRMVALLSALILVAGLAAVASLPRLEDPHIVNRHAILVTPFPGASAERVESLIAEPLENSIRTVPEVLHITSHSSGGVSVIVVQLDDAVQQDA
ncbi:MAG: efflux RND transporter permease subunit, partial [Gammaproteobacteria bacterium]|nr:efflux RND transporter permease subunit [Gammaproteobacteria bacterium]MBU1833946.1 efflux RND transporter permease subunit [Gammaproteobacteria bacterium]